MIMKKTSLIILFIFIFAPLVVFAHPGRTDSSGCHTCRTNCAKWGLSTGEYHCHRAKALPQPKEPVKSHFSETGGYVTPAPEYKNPIITKPKVTTTKTTTTTAVKPVVKPAENKASVSWFGKLLKSLFK